MTPEEITAIIEAHRHPTLHAGDTGINVITLQIWLQMLGFYKGPITGLLDPGTSQAVDAFRAQQQATGIALQAPAGAVLARDTWETMDNLLQQRLPPDPATLERQPFPRRSAYDSEAKYQKALYEGLRVFGFPVKPAEAPLRIPIVINERGIATLHGLPLGAYTLELGDTAPPGQGSADIQLEDADGDPFSGQIRLVRDGAEHLATVVDGHALVSGLEPGDYQVIVEKVDDADQLIDNTGSLEIRVVDASYQPLTGIATLLGESGDAASLQQTVRLFQALSRKLTRGLEPDDKSRLGNILTGDFAETAHRYHERIWDQFGHTWGRFYGAPWLGVVFHSLDDGKTGDEQQELNWGERETIDMLYAWGDAYLRASRDAEDLEERLRRPIAIRYIAHPQGGSVDGRADFSQIGTDASLHLPRKSSTVIDGIVTGQLYGGIDYDSPDYSTTHLGTQLSAFAAAATDFGALCSEATLVDRLLPQELQSFQVTMMKDGFARNRSINCFAKKSKGRAASSTPQPGKEIFYGTLSKYLSAEQMKWLRESEEKLYTTANIKTLLEVVFKDRETELSSRMALRHIKSLQKALWLCRLLMRTDWPDRAMTLSDGIASRGYHGLFEDHGKIDEDEFIGALDWKNPWQLEALVEFYVNYNDPWMPALKRSSLKSYRDGLNRPRLPGERLALDVSSKMSAGLHFVLVDPYGPRLSGDSSVAAENGTDVKLMRAGSPDEFGKKLEQVNAMLDTIRFLEFRGGKTYRIAKRDVAKRTVTLEIPVDENLEGIKGPWQIPAGVGGPPFPSSPYVMTPNANSTCDHYDGVLFVVKDGQVANGFHFSSYTSHAATGISELSIRGNQSYRFHSARAGGGDPETWGKIVNLFKSLLGKDIIAYVTQFINYAFHIQSSRLRDAGRYYFRSSVGNNPGSTKYPSGIWDLFIHYGHEKGKTIGSRGCLVSPEFYSLRKCVLDLYPNLKTKFEKMYAADHELSNKLRNKFMYKEWNDIIHGTLWVIRPDERPLAPSVPFFGD